MEQLSVYQSRVFPDLKCVSVKSHVVRNEMRRGRVGQYFDTKCISASQQTKRIVQMLKALRQFDKLDIPPREFGPIYQWYYGDLMLPIDADYKRRLQDKIQSKPSQCPTKSQIRNFENPSSIGSGSSLSTFTSGSILLPDWEYDSDEDSLVFGSEESLPLSCSVSESDYDPYYRGEMSAWAIHWRRQNTTNENVDDFMRRHKLSD